MLIEESEIGNRIKRYTKWYFKTKKEAEEKGKLERFNNLYNEGFPDNAIKTKEMLLSDVKRMYYFTVYTTQMNIHDYSFAPQTVNNRFNKVFVTQWNNGDVHKLTKIVELVTQQIELLQKQIKTHEELIMSSIVQMGKKLKEAEVKA